MQSATSSRTRIDSGDDAPGAEVATGLAITHVHVCNIHGNDLQHRCSRTTRSFCRRCVEDRGQPHVRYCLRNDRTWRDWRGKRRECRARCPKRRLDLNPRHTPASPSTSRDLGDYCGGPEYVTKYYTTFRSFSLGIDISLLSHSYDKSLVM